MKNTKTMQNVSLNWDTAFLALVSCHSLGNVRFENAFHQSSWEKSEWFPISTRCGICDPQRNSQIFQLESHDNGEPFPNPTFRANLVYNLSNWLVAKERMKFQCKLCLSVQVSCLERHYLAKSMINFPVPRCSDRFTRTLNRHYISSAKTNWTLTFPKQTKHKSRMLQ